MCCEMRADEFFTPVKIEKPPYELGKRDRLAREKVQFIVRNNCILYKTKPQTFSIERAPLLPAQESLVNALKEDGIKCATNRVLGPFVADVLVERPSGQYLDVEIQQQLPESTDRFVKRDAVVKENGYKVVRLWLYDALKRPEECRERIIKEIEQGSTQITISLKDQSFLDEDAQDQREAARHLLGPARTIAPAGSGKTRVIAHRIQYLVSMGVNPSEITALAFNRKAADEMRARLRKSGTNVDARTLHSFGWEIYRKVHPDFKHLGDMRKGREEDWTKRDIIRGFVRFEGQARGKEQDDPLDSIVDGITSVKINLKSPEEVAEEIEMAEFPNIFNKYQDFIHERKYEDFSGMIYHAIEILIANPAIRHEYQEMCNFFLVDEFQDLNEAQLLLARILATPNNNIFAVGDDDQMIYGFRGAKVANLTEFEKYYPGTVEYYLGTNYRCPKTVVDRSESLISKNTNRIKKPLESNKSRGTRDEVTVESVKNIEDEANTIAKGIAQLHESENTNWGDIVVLFRVNAVALPIQIALGIRGIPYTRVKGNKISGHWIARDFLSYIKTVKDIMGADGKSVSTLVKRSCPYANKSFLQGLESSSEPMGFFYEQLSNDPMMRNYDELLECYTCLYESFNKIKDNHPVGQVVAAIVKGLKLEQYYEFRDSGRQKKDAASNVDVLLSLVSIAEFCGDIDEYIEILSGEKGDDFECEATKDADDKEAVQLKTIHTTKGLEFDYVFLARFADGILPHKKGDIEEERRLCYVAMTRAKKRLFLLHDQEKPSAFFDEIFGRASFPRAAVRTRKRPVQAPVPRPPVVSYPKTRLKKSRRRKKRR